MRPPAEEMRFFNGRNERDRVKEEYGAPPRDDRYGGAPRDDYGRRDDYAGDNRGGGGGYEDRKPSRWDDDRGREPERGRDPAPADQGEYQWFPAIVERCKADLYVAYLLTTCLFSCSSQPIRSSISDGPRKRRSRWGDATERVEVPGLPVHLSGNVSQTELNNYAVHVRLEEINRKLRTGDVVPPEGQRSPSPRPTYDAYGRRTNTREIRYRKKLEDERLRLVDRAMKSDPNFRPPADVQAQKRFSKPQDKVYIPVKEFPEINFFGLLVGPRGNSLKNMERQSGAKISIRGKGSVKEGKGRPDAWQADEDDELHCLVMADDEAKVKACVDLINKVIETVSTLYAWAPFINCAYLF